MITCTGTITDLQADRMSVTLLENEQLRTGGHMKLQLKPGAAEGFVEGGTVAITVDPVA